MIYIIKVCQLGYPTNISKSDPHGTKSAKKNLYETSGMRDANRTVRPRLHEQIKHTLFEQIRPESLHTDREFEQLKEVLFAYVNAALLTMLR